MKTFNELHQKLRAFVRSKTDLPFALDMYGGEKTKTIFLKVFKGDNIFVFMGVGDSVSDAMEKLLVRLAAPFTSWEFPNY